MTLNSLGKVQGFTPLLLEVLGSEQVPAPLRMSAAINLKNLIRSLWSRTQPDPLGREIGPVDREALRARIVPVVTTSPERLRQLLLPPLGVMIRSDFPANWPGLIGDIEKAMTADHQSVIIGGLHALYATMSTFQYKQNKKQNPIQDLFNLVSPSLVSLFTACIAMDTDEAATAVRLIMKIYRTTLVMNFGSAQIATFRQWCERMFQLIHRPVPPHPDFDSLPTQHERGMGPWWRAKKWALRILSYVYQRYVNATSFRNAETQAFAKDFNKNILPPLLSAVLNQLSLYGSGQFVSPRVLCISVEFISEAIRLNSAWKIVRPHFDQVFSHVLFKLVCFSDDDQELWEDDPHEFLRRKFNFELEYTNPSTAAISCINLAGARRKSTLMPMLLFCIERLNTYLAASPAERNYRHKDGALSVISTLADVLLREESFAGQIEHLLATHVLPEADSPAPFLRARMLNVLQAFVRVIMNNAELSAASLTIAVNALRQSELPLKVQAALCLSHLIMSDHVQNQIRPHVQPIIQELLALSQETELFEISGVIQTLVETFPEEIAPFAVQLCQQLIFQFQTINRELSETVFDEDNEADFEAHETKSIAVLSTIQTIERLVTSMSENPEALHQCEVTLQPLLLDIIQTVNVDFLTDALNIISAFTYFSEGRVSELSWAYLPAMAAAFNGQGFDFFSEMVAPLDNFISTNPADFLSDRSRLMTVLSMIHTVLGDTPQSKRACAEDRINACRLLETVIQNLVPHLGSAYEEQFLAPAMQLALSTLQGAKSPSLAVSSLLVVLSSVVVCPAGTMAALHTNGHLAPFLAVLLQNIKHFHRVHDKKLCIMAICHILGLPAEALAVIEPATLTALASALAWNLKTMPVAVEMRKEFEQYIAEELDEGELDMDFDDDEEFDGEGEIDEDQDHPGYTAEDHAYTRELAARAAHAGSAMHDGLPAGGDGDDDDDEDYTISHRTVDDVFTYLPSLEEEFDVKTPIDPVNPYAFFSTAFGQLATNNRGLVESLLGSVSAEERQVLEAVAANPAALEEASK
ncbi:hypothetical protein H696_02181 [Fonticula alba]|uniref:Importin N-terminal domain-containing protein n=1 Tax=Fonticula alba TaxID=691883 RepID=A0A058ZBC2_FONAL|nr:hypothetical protein H696_02181 [Fonticula alba]KCV71231.1 hypothetical protein H696_02181 [Fonticula alba]|eukprot:XP_009494354.1 hypothetical protein H696_02181 [Fonticula alba]